MNDKIKMCAFDIDGFLRDPKTNKFVEVDFVNQFFYDTKINLVPITGQSYENSKSIFDTYKVSGAAFEHGAIIYNDGRLRKVHKIYPQFYSSLESLKRVRNDLSELNGEISEIAGFEKLEGPLEDKEAMITYITNGSDTGKLLEILKSKSPALKDALQRGKLMTKNAGYAIDIVLPVTKGHAVEYFMNDFGVKSENVFAAGYSGHTDIDMMNAIPDGYAACPRDSTDDIKRTVEKFEKRGYTSSLNCEEGAVRDILTYAKMWWL